MSRVFIYLFIYLFIYFAWSYNESEKMTLLNKKKTLLLLF